MRFMKAVGLMAAAGLVILGLAGCDDNKPAPKAEAAKKDKTGLSLSTAGTGGTYYPLGGGMAKVLGTKAKLAVAVESTGGSVENARLLANKETDIAFMASDIAYMAYHGVGTFKDKKVPLAALFSMYAEPMHLVTLEGNNVNSVKDLKGKRVSVGAPGSGTEVKARTILSNLGLTYDDLKVKFLSFNDSADGLKDGNLDAAFMAVGAPAAAIMDLMATKAVKLIPFSPEEVDKILKASPYFAPFAIHKGAYEKIPYEVKTLSALTEIVVRQEMSPDLAYLITKTVVESKAEMVAVHKEAEEMEPDFAAKVVIPLHPGAEKYFRERGVLK